MHLTETFFEAYRRRVMAPGPVDDEAYAEFLRFKRPGLDRAAVMKALENWSFGSAGAESYVDFLSYASYERLECNGYMDFIETTSLEGWAAQIAMMRFGLDRKRELPFAYDSGTSATFFLDRRDVTSPPMVSIADGNKRIRGAFSSFDALLAVMSALVASETALYIFGDDQPSKEQRTLVARLKSLDPPGFGSIGWPMWFSRSARAEQL